MSEATKGVETKFERPKEFQPPMVFTFQDEYDFLSEQLPISQHKLPEILETQNQLIDMAGECLNKTSRQFNQMKLLVETKEAEVYLQIRRGTPTDTKKPTEPELAAMVATHPEVVGMKQVKLEAEDIKNRWLNRKMSLECRSRDTHDMVSLITCGYIQRN